MANIKIVIKTPPAAPGPVHSVVSGSTIYHGPAGATGAIGLSYIRNNRLVGYFADAQLAKDSLAFHIQRENEFGADV